VRKQSNLAGLGDTVLELSFFGKNKAWLIPLLIVLVGLVLRLIFLQPPVNSDDVQYFITANTHLQPSVEEQVNLSQLDSVVEAYVNHSELRLTLNVLPLLFQSIFGYSVIAYYLVVFLGALITATGIYSFSRVVSGRLSANIALLLWAGSYVFLQVDTRFTPDNIGVGFSLIGLAWIMLALKINENSAYSNRRRKIVPWCLVVGGVTVWLAWSTRATFAPVGLVGALAIYLYSRNMRMLALYLGGGLLGLTIESIVYLYKYGNPFVRLELLLGYGDSIAGAEVFQGYTVERMLDRYPRLFSGALGEQFILTVGIMGVGMWLLRPCERFNFIKLAAFFLISFPILFALASIDPLLPFMREKLRYSAVFVPFLYLAAADLVVQSVNVLTKNAVIKKFKFSRITLIMIIVLLPVCFNIFQVSESSKLFMNGNNALFRVASIIEKDQLETGSDKRVCVDFRTLRVTSLLLSPDEGWEACEFETMDDESKAAYIILNWRRLNANVKHGYVHGPIIFSHYDDITKYSLLMRHRRGAYITDVFKWHGKEVERKTVMLKKEKYTQWVELDPESKETKLLDTSSGLKIEPGIMVSTGVDAPWRYEGELELQGKRLFKISVDANSEKDKKVPIMAYLYLWSNDSKKPFKQYMGRAYVDEKERKFVFWTYLPADTYKSYKVAFKNSGKYAINTENIEFRLLNILQSDVIKEVGAW